MLVLIACAVLLAACNRNTGGGDGSPAAAAAAETIYNRTCVSCHSMGAAGAPRIGDKTAWAPRIAKGRAALLQSALHGVPPGMPAKGLCIGCSDDELRAVIDYMISRSK